MIAEGAEGVLREVGGRATTKEIADRLVSLGRLNPGLRASTVLTNSLVDNPRSFVRVARGTWELVGSSRAVESAGRLRRGQRRRAVAVLDEAGQRNRGEVGPARGGMCPPRDEESMVAIMDSPMFPRSRRAPGRIWRGRSVGTSHGAWVSVASELTISSNRDVYRPEDNGERGRSAQPVFVTPVMVTKPSPIVTLTSSRLSAGPILSRCSTALLI